MGGGSDGRAGGKSARSGVRGMCSLVTRNTMLMNPCRRMPIVTVDPLAPSSILAASTASKFATDVASEDVIQRVWGDAHNTGCDVESVHAHHVYGSTRLAL